MPSLTANQTSTLTQILAATDVLWTPHRWRGGSDMLAAAAISERRFAFPDRGVPLVISGGGTQRLAGERELLKLAADGLIRLHHGGKRIGVSLTEHGDDHTRALTAGYRARDVFRLLKLVTAAKARCGGDTNGGCVLEVEILKTDYDRPSAPGRIVRFAQQALPLLARGWLSSSSDTEGRIGYSVPEAGLRAIKPKRRQLPASDDVAIAEYDELFEGGMAERATWKPTTPSLVWVPLPAGMWPEVA